VQEENPATATSSTCRIRCWLKPESRGPAQSCSAVPLLPVVGVLTQAHALRAGNFYRIPASDPHLFDARLIARQPHRPPRLFPVVFDLRNTAFWTARRLWWPLPGDSCRQKLGSSPCRAGLTAVTSQGSAAPSVHPADAAARADRATPVSALSSLRRSRHNRFHPQTPRVFIRL